MNISQLNTTYGGYPRAGATTVIRNLKVELYQRFVSPSPASSSYSSAYPSRDMHKRATGSLRRHIDTAGFLYYVLTAVSIAMGKSGLLLPASRPLPLRLWR
jgi:hypothetical protein